MGVTGVGLSSIGETASHLKRLNIGKCQQIAGWAFQRVVTSCVELEDLDVSHCALLSDHDIKVMATSCKRLKKLSLRDTRQVGELQ